MNSKKKTSAVPPASRGHGTHHAVRRPAVHPGLRRRLLWPKDDEIAKLRSTQIFWLFFPDCLQKGGVDSYLDLVFCFGLVRG